MPPHDAVQGQPRKGVWSCRSQGDEQQEPGWQCWVSARSKGLQAIEGVRETPMWLNMTSRVPLVPTLPWLSTLSREAHFIWHLPYWGKEILYLNALAPGWRHLEDQWGPWTLQSLRSPSGSQVDPSGQPPWTHTTVHMPKVTPQNSTVTSPDHPNSGALQTCWVSWREMHSLVFVNETTALTGMFLLISRGRFLNCRELQKHSSSLFHPVESLLGKDTLFYFMLLSHCIRKRSLYFKVLSFFLQPPLPVHSPEQVLVPGPRAPF